MVNHRLIETQTLKRMLDPLNLQIKEVLLFAHLTGKIPPDGNCMYNALADQLALQGQSIDKVFSFLLLSHERITSKFCERWQLITCDLILTTLFHLLTVKMARSCRKVRNLSLSHSEGFKEYCDKTENSSVWGGQLELRALSNSLQLPIVVHGVNLHVEMGKEFPNQTAHLS